MLNTFLHSLNLKKNSISSLLKQNINFFIISLSQYIPSSEGIRSTFITIESALHFIIIFSNIRCINVRFTLNHSTKICRIIMEQYNSLCASCYRMYQMNEFAY